jgi:hypothetical protein
LSYAAALPFFLGVFFFALFGLMIGAAMVRIAAVRPPYPRSHVLAGTTMVVLFGWGLSIIKEGRDFPRDFAAQAADHTRDIGNMTRADYQALIADGIRKWLMETHPPGGIIGYVRWVVSNGRLEKQAVPGLSRTMRRSPRGWTWAVGAALSIGLLAFGVGSQTFPLRAGANARK